MKAAKETSTAPDYSWADYLDCMEGSDVVNVPRPAAQPTRKAIWQPLPGVLLAAVIAALAVYVGELPFWPFTMSRGRHPIEPVMLAILLGMILNNVLKLPSAMQPGIKFSVKKLLPLAIVLLGARLHFGSVMKVGLSGVLLSMLEIVVALGFFYLLGTKFALPRKLALLLGVGTAICGGTAIVATAPVVEADEKDVVFSVATVTLLGLVLMFALPVIGTFLQLSEKPFGIWAGLSIHQTPQVIAAGFAYGSTAGDVATIVKLARVCLLVPVVFFIGLFYARRRTHEAPARKGYLHLFPAFVLGFLGMALLRTLGLIPELTIHLPAGSVARTGAYHLDLVHAAASASKYLIVISMAAVGLETRFSAMRQTGLKPLVASAVAVVIIAAMLLGIIHLLGV